ncbi:MAG: hypothetical protein ACI9HA_002387 [Dinoroseobacter sp.]|jgi:hypothetical protein
MHHGRSKQCFSGYRCLGSFPQGITPLVQSLRRDIVLSCVICNRTIRLFDILEMAGPELLFCREDRCHGVLYLVDEHHTVIDHDNGIKMWLT